MWFETPVFWWLFDAVMRVWVGTTVALFTALCAVAVTMWWYR